MSLAPPLVRLADHRVALGALDRRPGSPPGGFPAWSRRADRRADVGENAGHGAAGLLRGDGPGPGLPRAMGHGDERPRQGEVVGGDGDQVAPASVLFRIVPASPTAKPVPESRRDAPFKLLVVSESTADHCPTTDEINEKMSVIAR